MITIGGTALPSDPGEGGAPLSTATPQPPGTPAAGTTGQASDAGHVHLPTTAAQAGALATALLTTRGDLIRRGAAAAERVALGAAGTRLRSDGTDPVWSEPDIVCTVAELATTYAPSAVLRGVIAYTTDAGVTYVCRRTAASTYAWALLAAGATAAAARTAISAAQYTSDATVFGAGWTIVAPTSGNAGTSAATLPGGGVGRITIGASGSMGALTGPRIERAVAFDARKAWRFRVTPSARTFTSGFPNVSLYLRSASTAYRSIELTVPSGSAPDTYQIGTDVSTQGPVASQALWDGAGTIEMRISDAGLVTFGSLGANGYFVPVGTAVALTFLPAYWGIKAEVGAASAAVCDLLSPVVESW